MKLASKPTPVRRVVLMLVIGFLVVLHIEAAKAPSLSAYVRSSEARTDTLRVAAGTAVFLMFAVIERLYYRLRERRRTRAGPASES